MRLYLVNDMYIGQPRAVFHACDTTIGRALGTSERTDSDGERWRGSHLLFSAIASDEAAHSSVLFFFWRQECMNIEKRDCDKH